ncbi:MAG: chemotaxis protein CheW [Gammaproteobacteria bacterium]|jgi:chemotaxis-related protein WspB|nr:chemotaxis protein CheW [Gammaproteobacteria bacterium]
MLFLQFYVGRERYIINARQILSVVPLLKMHKMVGVPDYMVGFINYQGQTLPVVDLSKLLSGKKSKSRLSTRIVLVDYLHADKHETLGFVVENATEVVKLAEEDFSPNIIDSESMPYLGAIANDAAGMLQKIDINGLIDVKVRDYLDWQAA